MYKKIYINKSYKAEGEEKRAFDETQWGEADAFFSSFFSNGNQPSGITECV